MLPLVEGQPSTIEGWMIRVPREDHPPPLSSWSLYFEHPTRLTDSEETSSKAKSFCERMRLCQHAGSKSCKQQYRPLTHRHA